VLAAGEDPFGGDLFLFISRRRDRAKILTYDGGGLVLWYKRLEVGRFRHPKRDETNVELDATALTMLLDGIDVEHVRRPAKWEPRKRRKETIDKQARV
jgi:transposase